MNRKTVIVADSSANLFQTEREGFQPVPLKILTDEKEYVDDERLDVASMLADLKEYKGRSGTACPSVGDWLQAFGDAQEVYGVSLTSHLSGCYAQCDMPPVPEDAIYAAFLRLYYNLKHNPGVLSFHIKQMAEVRKRQMLWSPAAVELNRKISDILNQSHALALLNRQGLVDPDIFISRSNQLAEQLRNAKQQKEKLRDMEYDQSIDAAQQLQEILLTGPEILDAFDGELFCELINRIILQSNTKIRFRLKNGLELPESIERTVR